MEFTDLIERANAPADDSGEVTHRLGDPGAPGGELVSEDDPRVSAPAIFEGVTAHIRASAAKTGQVPFDKLDQINGFSSEPMAKAVMLAAASHCAKLERQVASLTQTLNDQQARIEALERTLGQLEVENVT